MLTYINLDEAIQKMNDLYKADCDTYGAQFQNVLTTIEQ